MRNENEKDMRKGTAEDSNKPMDGSKHEGKEVSTGARDLAKDNGKDIKGDSSKSLDKDKDATNEQGNKHMRNENEKDMRKDIAENSNKPMDGSRHEVKEVFAGAKDLAKDNGKDIKGDSSKSLDKDATIEKGK